MSLRDYEVVKFLGKGSCCEKVVLTKNKLTGRNHAVKIINRQKMKDQNMGDKVRLEIVISKSLKHPHVICLHDVIETPAHIYLIMEYAESGELFDYLISKIRLQEDEARRLFKQIISGIKYCHDNNVVHRDLKPENLLLDAEYNIKIADFGFSNIMCHGHLLRSTCGSVHYAAPEVLRGEPYGFQVDIWSCGVILYALLSGKLPFEDSQTGSQTIVYNKIKSGRFAMESYFSEPAKDLISRILVVDSAKRITISGIRQHAWFRGSDQAEQMDNQIPEEVVVMGL